MLSRPNARLLVALALTALGGGCARPSTPEGIVLITIDTCRADRIGCYGSDVCRTPALDDLAGKGAVFLDATAPAPVALPSHCTILTGLYPDRHTVRDNGTHRLPDEALTLAEVLESAGWKTGAILASARLDRRYGTMQGFDDYDDTRAGDAPADSGGGTVRERIEALARSSRTGKTAEQVVDAALDWVKTARAGGHPFLLWVDFSDPHYPYHAPERFDARYGAESYEGAVAFVDEQVGRLVRGLGSARRRVLIAATADHGEALGAHGEGTHGFFVYQETMHVPWILEGPGIPAGTRVAPPVSLVQVMPTLLDAVGVEIPDGLDGHSALPLVAGTAGFEPDVVYGESLVPSLASRWAGLRSVRKGRWKLIDAPHPELYDLREDPTETTNVADANPAVVSEMQGELERHEARGGALPARPLESAPGALSLGGGAAIPADILRGAVSRLPDEPLVLGILDAAASSLPPQEAYDVAKHAATVSPRNPVVLDALGWAATRSGHAADAIAPLTDAWNLTEDPGVRAHLGVALAESGDVTAGREHVQAAVRERAELRSVPEVARWLPGGAGGAGKGAQ
jgi:arylsulfatase A-like enzyme